MGLEARIAQMPEKKRKLIENFISVGIIFTILYAFFSIIKYGANFMVFLQSSEFIMITILLIFLYFAWKLIKGGKFHIPDQTKQGKKTEFNIPDTYGVRKQGLGLGSKKKEEPKNIPEPKIQKPHLSIQKQQPKPPVRGTWRCPQCGGLAIGYQCKCGYRRN